MREGLKEKWVAALRTGQIGDQKIAQTTGVLSRPVNSEGVREMCCLGVLSEIARQEGCDVKVESGGKKDNNFRIHDTWYDTLRAGANVGNRFPIDVEVLPLDVAKWAGIDSQPSVGIKPMSPRTVDQLKNADSDLAEDQVALAALNDSTDLGFAGIADLIEEYL